MLSEKKKSCRPSRHIVHRIGQLKSSPVVATLQVAGLIAHVEHDAVAGFGEPLAFRRLVAASGSLSARCSQNDLFPACVTGLFEIALGALAVTFAAASDEKNRHLMIPGPVEGRWGPAKAGALACLTHSAQKRSR